MMSTIMSMSNQQDNHSFMQYISIFRIRLILALIALAAPAARGFTVSELIDSLAAGGCFRASVDYTVGLPQAQDDVRYSVRLESGPAAAAPDTLSPIDYIISWQLHAPSGAVTEGFSAYTSGHHYRFRGDRLQEYHTGWDAAPFAERRQNGRTFPGVQRTAQFASLLPGFMALELRDMAADTLYTLSLLPAPAGRIKLRTLMTVQGMDCMESVYTFATSPLRPLSVDTEANMGTISEQSTSARFSYDPALTQPCPDVTEEALSARWPDAFTRFRESNFRIENLPGSPLPAFSLPRPDGGRITHHRGEPLEAPAIIVLLDPSKGFATETVKAVREAADGLPFEPQVIWALTATNPESALALTGPLRPGESAAISASGLARDCGAASLPVIILCDSAATVRNVVLGFNNDLASVVIQKMSILK